MYTPASFKVDDEARIAAFIEQYPFATLVGTGPEPPVSHLPMVLRRGPAGLVLVGHVARANSHWRVMGGATPALAIFLGPHAYVSPTWYATAPAVPTWNYVAVHALGRPRVVDDAAFTRETLTELVARHEPTPDGWSTAQLPPEKLDSLVAAIVAFEMPIERLEAKFKLGQNRSQADRDGTLAGLERSDSPDAAALAAFMRAHFQP